MNKMEKMYPAYSRHHKYHGFKPKRNDKNPFRDRCQTPSYAVHPIAKWVAGFQVAWEPFGGMNYLAATLHNLCPDTVVWSTDLMTGVDFLNSCLVVPKGITACIVSNPPFSKKAEVVEKLFDLGYPWAMLMPTEAGSLMSIGWKWFARYKVHRIWLYPRVNFRMPLKGYGGSGAQFPVIWWTWRMGLTDDVYVKMNRTLPDGKPFPDVDPLKYNIQRLDTVQEDIIMRKEFNYGV